MTSERFEHLLLGARDAANMHISSGVISGETGESVEDDHRAVWHAAEVALGILRLRGYRRKGEALEDARAMLRWVDGEED
jgi:hypothetical protein